MYFVYQKLIFTVIRLCEANINRDAEISFQIDHIMQMSKYATVLKTVRAFANSMQQDIKC